jgi:hypothetical protein
MVVPTGAHVAQLAVEIGLCRRQGQYGRGNRRMFMRPVEPSAGQEAHRTSVQPRMRAMAVEPDLVQPFRCRGRFTSAPRISLVGRTSCEEPPSAD